jgi:5-methylcytosine-specific restriction enzyme subunit McrC
MSLINAKEYFIENICDNQFVPISICDKIELNEDFYCDTYQQQGKIEKRRNAVSDYLKDIRKELETIELNQHQISFLIEDGEFDINKDNPILTISGDDFYSMRLATGNIVGSLNLKGEQLNINCRFGNNFLAYMIANTSGFIELENFGSISNQFGLGQWILLLYWKNRLKRAFAQGIYKTYQKKREILTTIRGTIDMNYWMNKEYFDGKTLCEFKEHSYDNNINKVIYLALRKVARSPYANLLNEIYEIKRTFDSIPFSTLDYNFNYNRVSNPYYKNYNEVFSLSQRIIQDNFMNVSRHDARFSAFLFDISLLFEHHIRKVLKRKFLIRPKDRVEFYIPNGISINKVYPDIIVDYGNNEIGVFDVKYKRFQTNGSKPGVTREDRFQLISYVALYSYKYRVVKSGFIYPCEESLFEVIKERIQNDQSICIAGNEIPFRILLYKVCDNIQDQHFFDIEFCKQMEDSVSKLIINN